MPPLKSMRGGILIPNQIHFLQGNVGLPGSELDRVSS